MTVSMRSPFANVARRPTLKAMDAAGPGSRFTAISSRKAIPWLI